MILSDKSDTNDCDEHVLAMVRSVIQSIEPESKGNKVALAQLLLLLRVANSWRSIRTLRENTPDSEGFMVDAGTLLRAMYDAYVQAAYISHDRSQSTQLACNYLDFKIVEKVKRSQAIRRHDTLFAKHLNDSPHREEGEKRLQEEYDDVKDRFLVRRRKDGIVTFGPRTRNTWFEGDLATLANKAGLSEEYDTFLSHFSGCVHSSSWAVEKGPLVSPEFCNGLCIQDSCAHRQAVC